MVDVRIGVNPYLTVAGSTGVSRSLGLVGNWRRSRVGRFLVEETKPSRGGGRWGSWGNGVISRSRRGHRRGGSSCLLPGPFLWSGACRRGGVGYWRRRAGGGTGSLARPLFRGGGSGRSRTCGLRI